MKNQKAKPDVFQAAVFARCPCVTEIKQNLVRSLAAVLLDFLHVLFH